jgi:transposase
MGVVAPCFALTEACDDDGPHLITHVETTTAPTQDGAVTGCLHADLREQNLLPTVHLVDTGFTQRVPDAELLANSSQEYGVDLFGPMRGDYHRQAQAQAGFDAQQFTIDWAAQPAICPAGCRSSSWYPAVDKRVNDVIKIKFAKRACGTCQYQAQCTD